MSKAKHPWLWLLLALWLVMAEAWAVTHSQEHNGLDDQHRCTLCHFAQQGAKGVSHATPVAVVDIQHGPATDWCSKPTSTVFLPSQRARGPPLL
ncbi:hypothetical protein [Gallaecimonas sp. GXIMD4217]|uniref:hypothetical protein n=1 Tax=Gallaecimonas sp. GXIMD4217 TaxID=3131927 RepID=UPI00311AE9E4